MTTPQAKSPEPIPAGIDLGDARLAAFLAWLVPGLGHLYQRRTGKGLLFMIAILGTFFYGLYLDPHVVYASTTNPVGNFAKFKDRWHYACQLGVGLPALPAYIQTWRVESGLPPLGDFERPPWDEASWSRVYPNREREFASLVTHTVVGASDEVRHQSEAQMWQYKGAFRWDAATVYTIMAGLMNLLAICDARWGPLMHVRTEDEELLEKNKQPRGA